MSREGCRTNRRTDVDRLNPVAALFLLFMWDSVRHNYPLELTTIERFDGVSAQNAVRDNGYGVFSTMLNDHISSLDEGSTSIGHVIYDDSGFPTDIADKDHLRDLIRPSSLLVN
jgi:hypothetical protein